MNEGLSSRMNQVPLFEKLWEVAETGPNPTESEGLNHFVRLTDRMQTDVFPDPLWMTCTCQAFCISGIKRKMGDSDPTPRHRHGQPQLTLVAQLNGGSIAHVYTCHPEVSYNAKGLAS